MPDENHDASHSHPAAWPSDRLLAECDVRFDRRSGPGGQNRNKVETAAVLTHRPTGITAEANEWRTQGTNRQWALHRLRLRLALEVRKPSGSPSELWRRRSPGGKIRVNPEHDDFPALLAEALDHLAARDGDFPEAAGALGCSASQLRKLLQLEPRAMLAINQKRLAQGLHPLK